MNIIAFVLAIVAAIVFFLVPDGFVGPRTGGRTSVALGLGILTVAWIVQLCTATHTIHF